MSCMCSHLLSASMYTPLLAVLGMVLDISESVWIVNSSELMPNSFKQTIYDSSRYAISYVVKKNRLKGTLAGKRLVDKSVNVQLILKIRRISEISMMA